LVRTDNVETRVYNFIVKHNKDNQTIDMIGNIESDISILCGLFPSRKIKRIRGIMPPEVSVFLINKDTRDAHHYAEVLLSMIRNKNKFVIFDERTRLFEFITSDYL
jgi:hypothetical protein